MNYNIIGIFSTEQYAQSASEKLENAGFIKEFRGYIRNTKFQPESLVEDHYLEKNEIHVYTPNLNRAYKALHILVKLEAEIKDAAGLKIEGLKKLRSKTSPSAPSKFRNNPGRKIPKN